VSERKLAPRRISPKEILTRLRGGETLEQLFADYPEDGYHTIARLKRKNDQFAEKYNAIMGAKAPGAIPAATFDDAFFGWKQLYIQILGELIAENKRPTRSAALAKMNALGYPVTVSRITAVTKEGGRFYDEEFAIEVEALGEAQIVNDIKEKLEESLLSGEGRDSDRLNYLKANPASMMSEKSRVQISSTSTHTNVDRREIQVTISAESQELAARIRGELANANNSNNSTELEGGHPVNGANQKSERLLLESSEELREGSGSGYAQVEEEILEAELVS